MAADSSLTRATRLRAKVTRDVGGTRDEAAWPRGRAASWAALAALAVAVRLAWVLAVPTHPVGDFAMYWESAGYVVEHGALDPQFIYMPGYVLVLALVRALGGGLLAAKLLGVAVGGLATAAVTGIATRLFDRTSALAAGLLCALWPAGITVSSVVGTDMPAGALLVTAVWLLVRDAQGRPWRAAVLFGVVMGLAAYVRAVALPFVLFAAPFWWAVGAPWRRVVARTALSCAVAFLLLLPWGLRNQAVYGELFFTDSHGGHTALVGANPNTEGVYSRSLNRMFTAATGYELGEPPHRDADRAAYGLARQWTAFEPSYALGLLAAKADRLLTHERPLLYWPLYRQGVLDAETRAGFARHQAGLERLADAFWYALVAAAFVGLVVAASRRLWPALALLPLPLALAALYVVFFAEVRYHLAIAVFLFPYAGLAWRWLTQTLRDLAGRRLNERGRRRLVREALLALVVVVGLFVGVAAHAWRRAPTCAIATAGPSASVTSARARACVPGGPRSRRRGRARRPSRASGTASGSSSRRRSRARRRRSRSRRAGTASPSSRIRSSRVPHLRSGSRSPPAELRSPRRPCPGPWERLRRASRGPSSTWGD